MPISTILKIFLSRKKEVEQVIVGPADMLKEINAKNR